MALQEATTTAQQVTPWIPVVAGAVAVMVGQLFAILLEWLRGRAAAAREREARAQARKEALADRRDEFQRQTLLELQDALRAFMRSGVLVMLASTATKRRTGTWQPEPQMSDEHEQQVHQAVIRLNLLCERVLDDDLRRLVWELRERQSKVVFARTEDESDRAHDAMMATYSDANTRLGEQLRALY